MIEHDKLTARQQRKKQEATRALVKSARRLREQVAATKTRH
jgi:hypothetical protein